jgi:hypothetical protein
MRRLLLLLLVGVAGCREPSLDDVLARRRSSVEQAFGAIAAAAATVAAAAPHEQPTLAPLEAKLDLRTNAAFVHAADLAAPGEAQPLPVRTLDSEVLLHCGSLLTKKTFFQPLQPRVNVKAADAALGRCVDLRYLLVIRGRQYRAPVVDELQQAFAPGRFEGDVVVFDLATKRVLGGYPFSVENERTLQVPEGEPQVARLQRNLEALLYAQLRARLESLAPGAVPAAPL